MAPKEVFRVFAVFQCVYFSELTSEGCPTPQLALNGTETEEGEVRIRKDYKHVREVKFFGSIGPLNEKRLCKIKCIEGQWVGPLCVDQHGTCTVLHLIKLTERLPRDEATLALNLLNPFCYLFVLIKSRLRRQSKKRD